MSSKRVKIKNKSTNQPKTQAKSLTDVGVLARDQLWACFERFINNHCKGMQADEIRRRVAVWTEVMEKAARTTRVSICGPDAPPKTITVEAAPEHQEACECSDCSP